MGRGLSAASKDLIQRAYALLEREHPSGVRRVAYGLFGNQADDFVKKLGKQLSRARKRGWIPWEWISDDTRREVGPYIVEDMGELRRLKGTCPSYDPWPSQAKRVVIWSEKSLGGTLQPVIDDLLVGFQVHHGNTSDTVMHQAAEWCRAHPTHLLIILYVGDHDCKGLRISEDDIPKRMRDERVTNYRVTRVAILQPDAEAVRVEDRDAFKPKDPDISWYCAKTGLSYGVEVEAIPSTDLRERVEAAIKAEIVDVAAWNRVMEASRVVRESWEAYVDRWPIPTLGAE
jgi:hypothetical protein